MLFLEPIQRIDVFQAGPCIQQHDVLFRPYPTALAEMLDRRPTGRSLGADEKSFVAGNLLDRGVNRLIGNGQGMTAALS
jgi:hypothetical protein